MGRDAWPDFSVQISSRPWRCVPDPLLCMSRDGAAFLGALAEELTWPGTRPAPKSGIAPEFFTASSITGCCPMKTSRALGALPRRPKRPGGASTIVAPVAATARHGRTSRWKAVLGSRCGERELLAQWNGEFPSASLGSDGASSRRTLGELARNQWTRESPPCATRPRSAPC